MAETWLRSCTKVPYPNPLTRLDQYAATSGVPNGGNPYGNQILGVVNHSAEGYFSGSNTPNAVMQARGNSWPITVYKSGRKEQHFPLEAMCWHAGRKANYRFIGIEHEGKVGEALTAAQLKATIEVQSEICRIRGWAAIIRGKTGFEHNEFMSTSCPSGRIPWREIEAGTRAQIVGIWAEVKAISKKPMLYADVNLVSLPSLIFVKKLLRGTEVEVGGIWRNSHYISRWSMERKIANGFSVVATVAPAPPTPTPPPPPPPTPVPPPPPPPPPPVGIWSEVRAVDKTVTLHISTNLVSLPDLVFVKKLDAGTDIEVGGVWRTYYISRWSFDRKIANGFAVSATVEPVPVDPCAELREQVQVLQSELSLSRQLIADCEATIKGLRTKIENFKKGLQDLLTSL